MNTKHITNCATSPAPVLPMTEEDSFSRCLLVSPVPLNTRPTAGGALWVWWSLEDVDLAGRGGSLGVSQLCWFCLLSWPQQALCRTLPLPGSPSTYITAFQASNWLSPLKLGTKVNHSLELLGHKQKLSGERAPALTLFSKGVRHESCKLK